MIISVTLPPFIQSSASFLPFGPIADSHRIGDMAFEMMTRAFFYGSRPDFKRVLRNEMDDMLDDPNANPGTSLLRFEFEERNHNSNDDITVTPVHGMVPTTPIDYSFQLFNDLRDTFPSATIFEFCKAYKLVMDRITGAILIKPDIVFRVMVNDEPVYLGDLSNIWP